MIILGPTKPSYSDERTGFMKTNNGYVDSFKIQSSVGPCGRCSTEVPTLVELL